MVKIGHAIYWCSASLKCHVIKVSGDKVQIELCAKSKVPNSTNSL